MTRDDKGRPVFIKGRRYAAVSFFSALWPPGVERECLDTADFIGADSTIRNGKGYFRNGDDIRWWVATDQFTVVK